MTKQTRKLINISLALAMTACLVLSMTGFTDSCDDMYQNIIRIRVIANSDSEIDQSVKLKVRDRILSFSKELFSEATTYDDAVLIAKDNIRDINREALDTVLQNGLEYSVTTEIRQEYFDTREYEGFSLPAGSYETLVVTLGDGEGNNWWCVMYPQVCVGSCAGELTDSIAEDSAQKAQNAEKYVVKFKTVEIFQKIKSFIQKNSCNL